MSTDSEAEDPPDRRLGMLGKLVCAVFIAAAIVYVFQAFFTTRVCDDAALSTGTIGRVCRHVQLTDPPIVAALAAALISAAVLFGFTKISALGVSLERSVAAARQAAKTATNAATSAKSTASRAERSSNLAENLLLAGEPAKAPQAAFDPQLATLTAEYDTVRGEELSSSARTAKLTSIVARMIALFSATGKTSLNFDVRSALLSSDLGTRVSGYAYAYTYPSEELTLELVEALVTEAPDHRFGQYWALRALRKNVIDNPDSLDQNSRRRLEVYRKTIGPSTDRAYELNEILKIAPVKP